MSSFSIMFSSQLLFSSPFLSFTEFSFQIPNCLHFTSVFVVAIVFFGIIQVSTINLTNLTKLLSMSSSNSLTYLRTFKGSSKLCVLEFIEVIFIGEHFCET